MLDIRKVDHIGIRIHEKSRSIAFYELLGFKLIVDTGFEKGHPIMMEHPSGVVLNLLGPSTVSDGDNVLMDTDEKHPGYTHMALRIASLDDAKVLFDANDISITGSFSFKDMNAVFVRDPDRNVIEFDEYPGDSPASRASSGDQSSPGYDGHP
jgi:catechol 2,3-dioxygenase-like lactoylglutathione lyase family enzyme